MTTLKMAVKQTTMTGKCTFFSGTTQSELTVLTITICITGTCQISTRDL